MGLSKTSNFSIFTFINGMHADVQMFHDINQVKGACLMHFVG